MHSEDILKAEHYDIADENPTWTIPGGCPIFCVSDG